MAAKTDMLKGKISILLIIFGIATIFLTLLFMYMNSGYANAIDLTAAQPILIGQILLLIIVIGSISIVNLWFNLFNMAAVLKMRTDISEIRTTVEGIAIQLAKEDEKKE